jgi:alkylation response protein AidB-like acyl-CoA dehydrogenase
MPGTTPPAFGSAELAQVIADIGAQAKQCKRAGEDIFAAIDLVRGSRLGAVRVPRAEGGGGWTVREYFSMLIDLADADADVAHILRSHYWFVEERMRAANPAVRERWVARVVAGDIFGNAITELGGGAAVGTWLFETKLTPHGDAYVLHGKKYYCTGSRYSDWVLVWAADPSGAATTAVVPVNREGVNFDDDWDGIGQRLTGSGSGSFDHVRVEPDEVLMATVETAGTTGQQSKSDPYLVGQFVQLILTAIIVGIMRSAVTDACATVRKRGRTYSHGSAEKAKDDPLLQHVVGQIASYTFAAEAAVLAAADAQDRALASIAQGAADFALTHRASLAAAQAKVIVDELAPRVGTMLFDVGGSSAITQREDLDRHWRNARTIASHNPTSYKARAIGDWLINATELPNNGFF